MNPPPQGQGQLGPAALRGDTLLCSIPAPSVPHTRTYMQEPAGLHAPTAQVTEMMHGHITPHAQGCTATSQRAKVCPWPALHLSEGLEHPDSDDFSCPGFLPACFPVHVSFSVSQPLAMSSSMPSSAAFTHLRIHPEDEPYETIEKPSRWTLFFSGFLTASKCFQKITWKTHFLAGRRNRRGLHPSWFVSQPSCPPEAHKRSLVPTVLC